MYGAYRHSNPWEIVNAELNSEDYISMKTEIINDHINKKILIDRTSYHTIYFDLTKDIDQSALKNWLLTQIDLRYTSMYPRFYDSKCNIETIKKWLTSKPLRYSTHTRIDKLIVKYIKKIHKGVEMKLIFDEF